MDRNITVVVAVFVSVIFSLVLMATGVGTALEDLFASPAPREHAGGNQAMTSLEAELRASQQRIQSLETELARQRQNGTIGSSTEHDPRLVRRVDSLEERMQGELSQLHEMLRAFEGNGGGGGTVDFGENVSAEDIARTLLESPALDSVVDQLRRQSERTAEEVYDRKRREEAEAYLIAQVEQAREAVAAGAEQIGRFTRNLNLDERSQEGFNQALVAYQNQMLDARLEAHRNGWNDERRQQHSASLREATIASLTSYGVEQAQAQRILRFSEMTVGRLMGDSAPAMMGVGGAPVMRPQGATREGGATRFTRGARERSRD